MLQLTTVPRRFTGSRLCPPNKRYLWAHTSEKSFVPKRRFHPRTKFSVCKNNFKKGSGDKCSMTTSGSRQEAAKGVPTATEKQTLAWRAASGRRPRPPTSLLLNKAHIYTYGRNLASTDSFIYNQSHNVPGAAVPSAGSGGGGGGGGGGLGGPRKSR